jgi:CheY-like chemotaxis protein
VLIVDDAEDDRELAATILGHSGFLAGTTANGLEGVIAAHCLRPVAVLMDVTVPVLDGIEAAGLLKASVPTRSSAGDRVYRETGLRRRPSDPPLGSDLPEGRTRPRSPPVRQLARATNY